MQQIQSRAEAEKAELALLQAKRETHLNDFIAHEVSKGDDDIIETGRRLFLHCLLLLIFVPPL